MRYINVTPKKFKSAFLQVVSAYQDRILDLWREPKDFTNLMMGDNKTNGVIGNIANKLGLQYHEEYWSIDCVFFKKRDSKNFKPGTFAEYLAVALEHENYIKTSTIELNKLSILNTPLKVLITYPTYPIDKTAKDYLSSYADILTNADIFSDFSSLRKHLIVFGVKEKNNVSWTFYQYLNGKFIAV